MVSHLREQEAAAVADLGIVRPELMPVIPQRQRLVQAARHWLEPPEMRKPFRVVQPVQPYLSGRAIVAEAQGRPRKARRLDRIVKGVAQVEDGRGGAIGLRRRDHAWIWVAPTTGRNMARYENLYWESQDGLRLHARDYAGDENLPPILCFPGLTRNARDFADLAERLAPARRVIAVNYRGRGGSAHAKDPMSYVPMTYLQDVEALLAALGIQRFLAFGTSLGGIVTMLLARASADRLAGVLLNDVGPELDPAGLSRLRGYVGRSTIWPTWIHAARAVAETNGDAYPNYTLEDWLAMAKRLYRLNSAGRIVLDYDMKIAEPFRIPGNEAGPDMWSALDRLKDVPTLIVRGARSDLLSAAAAERMRARLDHAELVTIADVGHAPTLGEPEALAGVDRLLARAGVEPQLA